MQLKTSRIVFATKTAGADGVESHSAPRIVISLAADDPQPNAPSAEETAPRQRAPIIRSFADVKAHIVPCRDCKRLLWVDRGSGIMQGVFHSVGAFDEAIRALGNWGKNMESHWVDQAD